MDFMPPRLPKAHRARTLHPRSCASPNVSTMPAALTFDPDWNKQGTLRRVKSSIATVDGLEESPGRRSRGFWHSFPKDGAWRAVTLSSQEALSYLLEPICRNCWHRGKVMRPAEVAAWTGAPMDTPVIALAARLVCSSCDYPAGYFHLHNPDVKHHKSK
jgi:hypothetical protein